MPSVKAPAHILLTGASGFIAVSTVATLIERGFTVTGTVRSNAKGDWLKNKFGEQFKYVIVEDVEPSDAFNEVIKVGKYDAIVHMASPVNISAEDPQSLIGPAVGGTKGILQAVKDHGPTVKRVVITSSVLTIWDSRKTDPYKFTEKDWNTESPELIEKEGKAAPGPAKYTASKTLAERAAWAFIEEYKGEITFDLTVLLPSFVIGPITQDIKGLSTLNETSGFLLHLMTSPPLPVVFSSDFVDVRDVALAHSLALESNVFSNNRLIISKASYNAEHLRAELLAANVPGVLPGNDNPDLLKGSHLVADGSKALEVLPGLTYRPIRDSLVDTFATLREKLPEVFAAKA